MSLEKKQQAAVCCYTLQKAGELLKRAPVSTIINQDISPISSRAVLPTRPKPSQHAFIWTHKKHSELRQYAITPIVVSSVSVVSSTPCSPQLSALTDPRNRYAPSHQVEASGVLVYGTFQVNSFIFIPCSEHMLLSFRKHQESLWFRDAFKGICVVTTT